MRAGHWSGEQLSKGGLARLGMRDDKRVGEGDARSWHLPDLADLVCRVSLEFGMCGRGVGAFGVVGTLAFCALCGCLEVLGACSYRELPH